MSASDSTGVRDVDGERMVVRPTDYGHRRDIIVNVWAEGVGFDFDRAGAVQLIEALTAAVEAADEREAKEARKLKRGDVVYHLGYWDRPRVVIRDEGADGNVDIAHIGGLQPGAIENDRPSGSYSRQSGKSYFGA